MAAVLASIYAPKPNHVWRSTPWKRSRPPRAADDDDVAPAWVGGVDASFDDDYGVLERFLTHQETFYEPAPTTPGDGDGAEPRRRAVSRPANRSGNLIAPDYQLELIDSQHRIDEFRATQHAAERERIAETNRRLHRDIAERVGAALRALDVRHRFNRWDGVAIEIVADGLNVTLTAPITEQDIRAAIVYLSTGKRGG